MEGHAGNNIGFSISMSFNPVEFESRPGDYIVVALKTVSLEFKPVDPTGWSWSEVVSDFVRANVDGVSVKIANQTSASQTDTAIKKAQLSLGGEVGIPIGKLTGALQGGRERTKAKQETNSRATEEQRTRRDQWVEMTRGDTIFNLRLDSPPGTDLVRVNVDLERLAVLSAPEPSAVKPDSVTVMMRLHLKGALRHAYSIRDAGGSWGKLVDDRNRQVVAELLMAKFLKPLHGPMKLWPPKPEQAT